jgi:hypothetical protein
MSISVGTKSLDEPGVTRNKQKNKMQSQNAINTHQGKCQSKGKSPSSNGWENAHLNKKFSFLFLTSKRTFGGGGIRKKKEIIIKTGYTTPHQSFMMDR